MPCLYLSGVPPMLVRWRYASPYHIWSRLCATCILPPPSLRQRRPTCRISGTLVPQGLWTASSRYVTSTPLQSNWSDKEACLPYSTTILMQMLYGQGHTQLSHIAKMFTIFENFIQVLKKRVYLVEWFLDKLAFMKDPECSTEKNNIFHRQDWVYWPLKRLECSENTGKV